MSPEIVTNLMVATMTREIANKPHPTPNPEGPHAAGSIRGTSGASGETLQPADDFLTDEPNYDSCVDDLALILSQPVTELDPALHRKPHPTLCPLLPELPRPTITWQTHACTGQ